MKQLPMTGAAVDTLLKLYRKGPQDDGDLPSKAGFVDLFEAGLAQKNYELDKPNYLTHDGYVQAYLITHELSEADVAVIDHTLRPQRYIERFLEFKERMGPVGIRAEWGHPTEHTTLFRTFAKRMELYGHLKGAAQERLFERITPERMRSIQDDLVCATLIDPEITDNVIVFRIIPTGPYGAILQKQLADGRRFKPGARMMLLGGHRQPRYNEVKEICAIDLIPENAHMDTGSDVCRPFVIQS